MVPLVSKVLNDVYLAVIHFILLCKPELVTSEECRIGGTVCWEVIGELIWCEIGPALLLFAKFESQNSISYLVKLDKNIIDITPGKHAYREEHAQQ